MSGRAIQIHFDTDLAEQLDQRRKETGCGTSEFVRRCVRIQLRKEREQVASDGAKK